MGLAQARPNKKISFKDLEFDQGDDVSTRYGVVGLSLWHQIAFSPSLPPSLSPSLAFSLSPSLPFSQFFERGQFGDVKRARWNEKVVAVKCFTSADRKGGFSEEVRLIKVINSLINRYYTTSTII